ncbi:MAG: glycine betaine ABC transporter substrate-binding protein [Eubacteriales bacterium]|nr:glycine betaine ABC transporter substrate-binding protein [Eubacteriales bacterium]
MKNKKTIIGLVTLLVLSLLVAGCGGKKAETPAEESVAEKFQGRVIGIEPGAGLMSASEEAIEAYGLTDYALMDGSSATMTATLADAIANEEWVIVTGWTPHWKFAKWDLKYLEDPKNVFGRDEQIHTLVRSGLDADMPDVYALLDNFSWTPDDMAALMVSNSEEGADEYANAVAWIEENADKVAEWIPEETATEKGTVKLIYVPWDSEIASTNVVTAVLQEKMGYDVELIEVDAGAMYQGLASGDADGMVAAWLPTTHGHYLDAIKDDVVDLGVNLDGTKIGWVVPSYVTIDSIEDLQPTE